jgi:hypothetical protein
MSLTFVSGGFRFVLDYKVGNTKSKTGSTCILETDTEVDETSSAPDFCY